MNRINVFRKLMKDKYYCGLDIGSQTIKAGLIEMGENQEPHLIGVYENLTAGFKNFSITDISELSEAIHQTIDDLSKRTGIHIKAVQLGIGNGLVEKRKSSAVIPLIDWGSKVIGQRDAGKVRNQAKILGTKMEEMVLHDIPQCYKIDDINIALNPIGLYGRKLEINSLLVLANHTLIKNLLKSVNQAGYEVFNIFYTSISSAEICLSEAQKQGGCVLIDMGSSASNILIFKDGRLQEMAVIPYGGDHITQNLARELNLPFDLAEDMKKSYAIVSAPEAVDSEEILIKKDNDYLPVKKEEILRAIEPVISDIIGAILKVVEDSGLADRMNEGIVMIGGGALLPGLAERIEQRSRFDVHVGKVHIAHKKLSNAAKFASSIGLAHKGMGEAFNLSAGKNTQAPWTQRMTNRIKDLYHEYF